MARNPQLETAILERPNDAARYAVYGDWLQAQGEPRGELVSVQAALASTRDTKRFLELKQTETRLLTEVTASIVPVGAQVKLSWRFGFVHHVELLDDELKLSKVLEHPALRFVQGVRLAMSSTDYSAVVAELIDTRAPLLNRLELRHGAVKNLAAFRATFPRLEHFVIEATPTTPFDAAVLLEWPELRTLEVTGVSVSDGLCAALRLAPWKKLRRLVLRPAGTVDDVSAVLALPELKQIGISAYVEGAVAAVCKRTNLSALQDLELFDFCTNERIAPILERAEAVRGLKLVIHQGELSLSVEKQLRKAVKGLALGDVEVYGEDEAGIHEMDDEEARDWRAKQERLAAQTDYNRDDWN